MRIESGTMGSYTLDDYFLALYRRKWILLLVVACTVVCALLASLAITPRYEAKTTFYVPDDAVKGNERGTAVITPARLPTGVVEQAKAYIGILRGRDAAMAVHAQFPQKSVEDLNRDVDFSPTRGGLITVFVRDADPQVAADLANAYFSYFNTFHSAMAEKTAAEAIARLDQRVKEADEKLAAAREAKRAFLEKNNVAALNTAVDEYEKQRALCRQNLQVACADLKDAEERIAGLTVQLKAENSAYQSGSISASGSTSLLALRQTVNDLDMELAALKAQVGEKHAQVLRLERKYLQAKANYDAELKQAVRDEAKPPDSTYEFLRRRLTAAEVDRDGARGRVKKYTEELGGLDRAIGMLPTTLAAAERYDDQIKQVANIKSDLEQARNEILHPTLKSQNTALVVETARPPRHAIFPILWLNAATAGVLGLAIGVLYCLFLEHLETRRRIHRVLPFAGVQIQLQSAPSAVA